MTDATSHAAEASAQSGPYRSHLDRLWKRGRDFLGTRTAVMGGAMSWVSERHLVSAISNAGGFGVLACGSMAPGQLAAEIAGTRALTDKPFGVNLINMHPALDQLIDVCREQGVGHVVVAGGLHQQVGLVRYLVAGVAYYHYGCRPDVVILGLE